MKDWKDTSNGTAMLPPHPLDMDPKIPPLEKRKITDIGQLLQPDTPPLPL